MTRDQIGEYLAKHEQVPHREHQLDGVFQLVNDTDPDRGRTIPRVFALCDEVGAGKTKQCVDSSQILWLDSQRIDTVVAFTPGFARSTWAAEDPLLGEVAKHAWPKVPNVIHEFHGDYTDLDFQPNTLNWVVSNYEFIRRENRLEALLHQLRGRRTWLILDESWAVKGFSEQMKACRRLRAKRADRVTLLNGTPLADGKPLDLYYPFGILDPAIIGAQNRTHFKTQYCIMGGYENRQVVGYHHLDELNKRIAPYVLSRRTRDCFDLPDMLPPVIIEARLTPTNWKHYTSMRDDMVSWLGTQVSVSKQAIVKALRLAQITSGYLGGLEEILSDEMSLEEVDEMPQWLRAISDQGRTQDDQTTGAGPVLRSVSVPGVATREIGREKLDAFLYWLETFESLPEKLLVWTRFRSELERTTQALRSVYPTVMNLKGRQPKSDRAAAKALLAPGGTPGRGAVVGNQKAGGASLNFSAASIMVFLSNGPRLIERTQAVGRIERPGQVNKMLLVEVVATGPKGQKTIDHHLLKALHDKQDMAEWTVQEWRRILAQE